MAAASRDPRFQPVSAGELPGLHIEISVLSPPRTIDHLDAIQVGVHGLMVGRGPSRGVLLPQVAVEQRWDAATFLSQTCIKAGLDGEAWRPWQAGEDQHLQVQVFQAQVFSEPQARATA